MGLELILDLKFTCIMRKSVEGLNLQFANNFGKLVEDSSHDFWDVDSSKNVEGMPNFLENWKEINSEMRGKRKCILFWKRECFNWRERIEGKWVVISS